jgi:outer membrane protein assembly factor BamB
MIKMNYKKNQIIKSVDRFDVKCGDIVYVFKNEIYYNDTLLLRDEAYNVAYFMTDSLIVYGNINQLFLFDVKKSKALNLDPQWSFYKDAFKENKVLVNLNRRKDSNGYWLADYFWFNLSTYKLEMKLFTDMPQIKILNSFGIIVSESLLKSICLLTGKNLWACNLKVSRIEKIIGIADNKLIIVCETHGQSKTFALNANTGNYLWEAVGGDWFSDFGKNTDSVVHLRSGGYWLNGVQLASNANVFREIDTNTGLILREGIIAELDKIGLNIKNFIILKDYIYFTANYQGSFGAIVIGVLNYEYLHLLWWQEVDLSDAGGFGNFLTSKPFVEKGKLYVLDKTNVLHIFERTDDKTALPKTETNGLIPFANRTHSEAGSRNHDSKTDEALPF